MRNFPESCGWSPVTTMHEVLDPTPAPKPKPRKPLRATILKDRWAVLHSPNLAVNHLSPSPHQLIPPPHRVPGEKPQNTVKLSALRVFQDYIKSPLEKMRHHKQGTLKT